MAYILKALEVPKLPAIKGVKTTPVVRHYEFISLIDAIAADGTPVKVQNGKPQIITLEAVQMQLDRLGVQFDEFTAMKEDILRLTAEAEAEEAATENIVTTPV